LEAELQSNLQVPASIELIGGKRGIFDVKCNDVLVYSKHEEGRFPEVDEVTQRLKERGIQ
jgi:selT/selW/selH-like putative selenoprotein